MITAAIVTEQARVTDPLRAIVRQHARVFEVAARDIPDGLPVSVPVDLVLCEVSHLTRDAVLTLQQIRAVYPTACTVCVATEEVAEGATAENALAPDFWIFVPASELQLRAQLASVLAYVGAGRQDAGPASATGMLRAASQETEAPGLSRSESALYRMMARMNGSLDQSDLLAAYCDAVVQLTHSVSYCLLWRQPREREFSVFRAADLPPMLSDICRLEQSDALPSWLLRNRGVVTRDILMERPEGGPVLRQLDLVGAVLAVPLFCRGVLRGIMLVGPKVIGEPYATWEAEALFALSATAAAALSQSEAHRELHAQNLYIDQVLSTMESGIITLGTDGTLRVCNPYAARVLELGPPSPVGSDLRILPTPLGDLLYSCMTYGEEHTRLEVVLPGGRVVLNVSTRRLWDSDGNTIGSMMLLEDVTAQRALAEERLRAERNDVISLVVARFAHELKNPLATIHTFAELLPARRDDPDFEQFWSEHVMRDVRRLDELVSKLLSLAEPPESTRQIVQVGELLRLAVERVALLDEEAPDHITQTIPDGLPAVRVDAQVMGAAFTHLIRHHLGHNHNPVTIEVGRLEGPADERPVAVYLRARDLHAGAVEPHMLFEPAYVLNHPDVDLGPSASQRLIESQGGAVEAYREDNQVVIKVCLAPARDAADSDDLKEPAI